MEIVQSNIGLAIIFLTCLVVKEIVMKFVFAGDKKDIEHDKSINQLIIQLREFNSDFGHLRNEVNELKTTITVMQGTIAQIEKDIRTRGVCANHQLLQDQNQKKYEEIKHAQDLLFAQKADEKVMDRQINRIEEQLDEITAKLEDIRKFAIDKKTDLEDKVDKLLKQRGIL